MSTILGVPLTVTVSFQVIVKDMLTEEDVYIPFDGGVTDEMDGAIPSTKTAVRFGELSPVAAETPSALLIDPPLLSIEVERVTPSVSRFPVAMVYRKTRLGLPLPEAYVAYKVLEPTVRVNLGEPVTLTVSL